MNKKITAIIGSIVALIGTIGAFFTQITETFFPKEEEVKTEQVMPSINISQQNVQKQDTNVETGDVSIDEELEELLK